MTAVLLEEDYKSRVWLWKVEMSEKELIVWWESIDDIDRYYEYLYDLPGKLTELAETDFIDEWEAYVVPGGSKTKKITLPENIYAAHIHSNNDSFLRINDQYYYHKGVDL